MTSVVRLVASMLVLLVAAPAAHGETYAPDGVDLVGPDHCCCPDESHDQPAAPRIERPCCCELRPAMHASEAQPAPAIVASHDATVAVPPGIAMALPMVAPLTTCVTVRAKARAPPVGSLFAHSTLLLL